MTETNRAVAGAAQTGDDETSEPTPARWLDTSERSVLSDVLPVWLPGLTRHQQADKWLRAEQYLDRGPRGEVAATILVRKFELLDATALLATEASLRELVQFEGRTTTRPAWLGGLNYLLSHPDDRPAATSAGARDTTGESLEAAANEQAAEDAPEQSDVGAGFDAIGDDEDEFRPPTEQSAVAADGGDDPAECPDCGAQRRADRLDGEDYWYCTNCEQGEPREVDADVGVSL